MSEALQQTRSLEVIGAEIRALTSSMLGNIIEIGRRMVEAKELLPHGEFGPWIKENTGYSHSTANNFMRLFEEYGARQQSLFGAEVENSQTFGKLSYTKALALLALPSEEEREAFVETHDVEAMSTRELQQAIRERDEARSALAKSQEELKETAYELDLKIRAKAEADERIKELEARPVDVAVQEPDPEVIQERAEKIAQKAIEEQAKKAAAEIAAAKKAAAAERKTWTEDKKAVEAKLEEAKKKLRELEEKAGEEKTDGHALQEAMAEIERLKKQLAMSDADTTIAKVLFAAWQEAYRKLTEAVASAPAETGDKLRAAIKAQAKAWAGEDA